MKIRALSQERHAKERVKAKMRAKQTVSKQSRRAGERARTVVTDGIVIVELMLISMLTPLPSKKQRHHPGSCEQVMVDTTIIVIFLSLPAMSKSGCCACSTRTVHVESCKTSLHKATIASKPRPRKTVSTC